MRLLLSIVTCGLSTSVLARSLTVSTPDWPPFYIHEEKEPRNKGLAWDILSKCTSQINKSVRFDMYPIRRMFKYMEDGSLDVNIMSYKPERLSALDYGKELVFENTYSVWVRSSLPHPVRTLDDLKNLNVALLIGLHPSDEYEAWLAKRLSTTSDKETLIVNEQEQILKMLASNRTDATIASGPEFRWRGSRLGLSAMIRDTPLIIKKQAYFFVLAKKSPFHNNENLLPLMDQCVKDMKKSGFWAALKNYYQL